MPSMNSIKCNSCGLKNFSSDLQCRRCGLFLEQAFTPRATTVRPRRFSIWSVLMIALVGGVFYYFYVGIQASVEEVGQSEQRRLSKQAPAAPGTPGLSRTKADQQRAGSYGAAVANSESLGAHNQHIKDTEKAMQQVSGSPNR
jgi:hypothetical protein